MNLCDWLEIGFDSAMAEGWHQGRAAEGVGAHSKLADACAGLYEEIISSKNIIGPQWGRRTICSKSYTKLTVGGVQHEPRVVAGTPARV